jgi:predicted nuclease of predicted toxin-antitoxin system
VRVIFNGMLSRDLVRRLSDLWPGSIQVTAEYGENYPDEHLWAEAERLGMTIITKDRDFADAARFPGPPPRVVRLKILNDRTAATELYLREHATEIEQFSTSSERYLEV